MKWFQNSWNATAERQRHSKAEQSQKFGTTALNSCASEVLEFTNVPPVNIFSKLALNLHSGSQRFKELEHDWLKCTHKFGLNKRTVFTETKNKRGWCISSGVNFYIFICVKLEKLCEVMDKSKSKRGYCELSRIWRCRTAYRSYICFWNNSASSQYAKTTSIFDKKYHFAV